MNKKEPIVESEEEEEEHNPFGEPMIKPKPPNLKLKLLTVKHRAKL